MAQPVRPGLHKIVVFMMQKTGRAIDTLVASTKTLEWAHVDGVVITEGTWYSEEYLLPHSKS
jgi:hypothetical protein